MWVWRNGWVHVYVYICLYLFLCICLSIYLNLFYLEIVLHHTWWYAYLPYVITYMPQFGPVGWKREIWEMSPAQILMWPFLIGFSCEIQCFATPGRFLVPSDNCWLSWSTMQDFYININQHFFNKCLIEKTPGFWVASQNAKQAKTTKTSYLQARKWCWWS